MNSNRADEIVIKKRRRRIAVDPCLGYYTHDGNGHFESSSQMRENAENKEKDMDTNAAQWMERQRKDAHSSDSAQTVTSPLSENTNLVTVDDFLRQQVQQTSTVSKKCRTTYSRKRQRRTLFSSDDDNDCDEDQNTARKSPRCFSSSARAQSRSKRAIRARVTKRRSPLQRKATSRAEETFSKRIQRAALLSSVEPDTVSDTAGAAASLKLIPREQLSPATTSQDKRVKLIDPRVPRHLDTTFANNEFVTPPRSKTKTYRPFFQWNCPLRNLSKSSTATFHTGSVAKDPTCRQPCLTITPLKLVPYEEHSEARAAKFDRKPLRGNYRSIAPLALSLDEETHASRESTANDKHDPFESLPLSGSLQPKASCQSNMPLVQADGITNLRQDTTSVVPETSQSPVSFHSDAPARLSDDAGRTPKTSPEPHAESLDICAIKFSGPSPDLAQSSPPPMYSQKPLRRLGTMLDGFRERARSILLSHSQSQALGDSTGGDPRPSVPRRAVSTRFSSQRIAFSSPARKSTPVHTSIVRYAAESDGLTLSAGPGEGSILNKARRSKSVSLPSVSAFLRRATITDKSEGSSSYLDPPGKHATSQITSFNSRARFAVDEDSAEVISDLSNSNFFSTYNSSFAAPNLSDLIKPPSGGPEAQIVLSPIA